MEANPVFAGQGVMKISYGLRPWHLFLAFTLEGQNLGVTLLWLSSYPKLSLPWALFYESQTYEN